MNSYNKSHRKHAVDLLGDLFSTDKELWEAYEKLATDFFKMDIDGIVVDGFVDENGNLYKFNSHTKWYGYVFKNNKLSSLFKLEDNEKHSAQQIWEYRK